MSASPSYARKLRKVYVFDGRETLMGEYETVTACAEALNVKRQAVTMAVSRASILAKKYYVSHQEVFTRQNKQKEFNPLRPPVRASRVAEGKAAPAEVPEKAALSTKRAVAAPTKAAAKRAPGITPRGRSVFTYLEEGAFGPFNSFH